VFDLNPLAILVIGRRLAIVIALLSFEPPSIGPLVVTFIVLLASLLLHSAMLPFTSRLENGLESMSLSLLIITTLSAAVSQMDTSIYSTSASSILIGVVAVVEAVFATSLLFIVIAQKVGPLCCSKSLAFDRVQ
jgi:chromate transport protein ChrA